ncbi:hypothetical protein M947_01385 [Sulfurimonas hongkongensis]|uniref:Uncharacterized protein n=1 Tax=Sulfurimonas hongkongensis TaxID=1172190 RepID=T0L3Q5_9BACT|nr:hypothetical protein M947_01385 [Sulfurimonas hongkongensis]
MEFQPSNPHKRDSFIIKSGEPGENSTIFLDARGSTTVICHTFSSLENAAPIPPIVYIFFIII